MKIKSAYHLLVLITVIGFASCTSDDSYLTVGEGVINDDHEVAFSDDFTMLCKTQLAEYVSTNNTGVALSGSYYDDYIGEITTNTVFKISPNAFTDNVTIGRTAIYDSIAFVLYPNDYVYGDSTKAVNFTLHKLTEDYELDTVSEFINGVFTSSLHKANSTTTAFDPTAIANISFIPEDAHDDSVIILMSDVIGEEWFNNIKDDHDHYTLNGKSNDTDEEFIENVLFGLTLRSVAGNSAVVGFNMPTSATTDTEPGMTIRLYYHTTGPYTELSHDFVIYDPVTQYNQITADFTVGNALLKGITPGGEGISSTETGGLAFIQSGLGLMTHIEIPSLYSLSDFGQNLTIIDMDLDFEALPHSFSDNFPLPLAMTMDRVKSNGDINPDGLLDLSGQGVGVLNLSKSSSEAAFRVPITGYGWEEKDYQFETEKRNTLLLTARYGGTFVPNINRMIIKDGTIGDNAMMTKMYYTNFK